MFNYNLYEVDYELSNELKMNRLRYPYIPQRVAQKRYFAVLLIKLAVNVTLQPNI